MEEKAAVDYSITPIETRYNGVKFRSRLEAKWAAMFDIVGWAWTYEPRDFRGWIPDFAIHVYRDIYVEVKPVSGFPAAVAKKMTDSGCDERMMIVGERVPLVSGSSFFGWYSTSDSEFEIVGFSPAEDHMFPGSRFGFMEAYGYHSDHREVTYLWREAGNRVRYEGNWNHV